MFYTLFGRASCIVVVDMSSVFDSFQVKCVFFSYKAWVLNGVSGGGGNNNQLFVEALRVHFSRFWALTGDSLYTFWWSLTVYTSSDISGVCALWS